MFWKKLIKSVNVSPQRQWQSDTCHLKIKLWVIKEDGLGCHDGVAAAYPVVGSSFCCRSRWYNKSWGFRWRWGFQPVHHWFWGLSWCKLLLQWSLLQYLKQRTYTCWENKQKFMWKCHQLRTYRSKSYLESTTFYCLIGSCIAGRTSDWLGRHYTIMWNPRAIFFADWDSL